jgi:hypothetical protein
MISNAVTVTTTAQKIVSKSNSTRTIYLHVTGAGTVYLGDSGVTSSNGLLTEKNAAPQILVIPAQEELWAVTGSGTESLRILKPSLYSDAS